MQENLEEYTHVRGKKDCYYEDDDLHESEPFIREGTLYPISRVGQSSIYFYNDQKLEHQWGVLDGEFYEYLELVKIEKSQLPETNTKTPMPEVKPTKGKIKSDGGSSDYYKIELPEWLLTKQKEQGFVMLEDLAEIIFGNDFNYTNIFKAQKRMFSLENGLGKDGNSFEYDATKCKYYVDKQLEKFSR